MEPLASKWRIAVTKLEGKTVAVYLLFRPNLKAHETHHFTRPDDDHLNIDVDRQNVPIGMELSCREGFPEVNVPARWCPPIEALITELFAFSAQMAAMARDHQKERELQRLGAAILQDILQAIPHAQDHEVCCT